MDGPKSNVTGVLMRKEKDPMIETQGKDVMGPEKQRRGRSPQTKSHQRLETTWGITSPDLQSAQRSWLSACWVVLHLCG